MVVTPAYLLFQWLVIALLVLLIFHQLQVCLNINTLFFEKAKLSVRKCSNTEITQYKNNVSNIKNTIKTKEVVSKASLGRKKLLELKKIADAKMKLKINTVEEIDSLILKNKTF